MKQTEYISYSSMRLFQKGIYLFLIYKTLAQYPTLNLLHIYPVFAKVFTFVLLSFTLLAFFNIKIKVSGFIIWILNLFLTYYLNLGNTSGDYLLSIFLFYFLFTNYTSKSRSLLNDVMIIAFKTQVILIYLVSSIYKLLDPHWLQGNAILLTMPVSQFNALPFLSFPSFIYVIINYVSMVYQLLFPLVIWFRKLKIIFLMIGVLIHLGISFVMGLFEFGIIMILAYLPFIDKKMFNLFFQKVGPNNNFSKA